MLDYNVNISHLRSSWPWPAPGLFQCMTGFPSLATCAEQCVFVVIGRIRTFLRTGTMYRMEYRISQSPAGEVNRASYVLIPDNKQHDGQQLVRVEWGLCISDE
jgi:hypothetical protein